MGKRSKQHITYSNEATQSNTNESSDIVIVVPGECIQSHIDSTNDMTSANIQRNKLGNGLRYDSRTNRVYATYAGRLMHKQSISTNDDDNDGTKVKVEVNTYYVEPHRTKSIQQPRRYYPTMNDRIVGIVIDRIGTTDEGGGDLYRIDINAAHYGVLSNLEFAGATKRNKPILQTGQIVYCRVLNDTSSTATNNADEPILLSCLNGPYDAGIPSKDWTTKENCYGELRNGGTVCRISMPLARSLLSSATNTTTTATSTAMMSYEPHNIILEELARHSQKIPFEVAIGMNGYIWINSTKLEYIILIQNAIQNSNVLTAEQIRAMVKNLIYIVDKQLQQRNDRS
jgi:exosome complex component RRP40